MNIVIKPCHLGEKLIPAFFAEEWKKKNNCDLTVKYSLEESEANGGLSLGGIFLIVVGIVTMVVLNKVSWGFYPVGLAVIVLGAYMMRVDFKTPPVYERAGHIFFAELSQLFTAFEIEPSEELSKLNREQFRSAVEDGLRAKAAEVNKASGFGKVELKSVFNEMHDSALKLGLCHESYTQYFVHRKPESKT